MSPYEKYVSIREDANFWKLPDVDSVIQYLAKQQHIPNYMIYCLGEAVAVSMVDPARPCIKIEMHSVNKMGPRITSYYVWADVMIRNIFDGNI